jgi:hypothetical protein
LSTGSAEAVPVGWLIWHDSGVRIRFAVIVGVLAVLSAACTGRGHSPRSSDPRPTPSASRSTATATATPSPTGPLTTGPGVLPGEKPPVLGADAKQHTPAGALAFAAYYFKAYDWGIATTDPYLVERISSPSCVVCRTYSAQLKDLRQKGGHIERGRTSVLAGKLVTGAFKTKSDYVVEFRIKEDAVVLVTPSAPPTTSAPASDYTSLVFVSWGTAGWQIVEEGGP